MEESNRNFAITVTEKAQRKLKEVAYDFGSQFASYHRRRINILCEEIFKSLEQNDKRALEQAEVDLQDTLYELDREVRLQYEEDEWDNDYGISSYINNKP
ncbi:MAG: hypothetical protein AAF383_28505 [Cyanobacteria bacterium P01_A01_bin.83]